MNKFFAAAALGLLAAAGPALAAPRQVTLSVPTMDCDTCPITIRVALMKVPGVSKAVVSYARRNAKVTFDDAKTTVAALTKATEEAGYPSFAADDR
ncbi:mercury resistance system periplasmic binding protein MerP [Ramlibacter alkalitolerans]|uniref:Periplasmic mercury ion-binding protein n=1 Tax=Ramlibacter alkalitolerans TaxID=2039631 RepID=A0ABS1JHJ1_9BURK|nr:mercury resistance system periplasmic binding protein MerP [Ramlibacter alkalitolerans]MBL0423678.1 mercury resistance system periplasmic binding protein MerP [Ramlibacter alkalitolerans]